MTAKSTETKMMVHKTIQHTRLQLSHSTADDGARAPRLRPYLLPLDRAYTLSTRKLRDTQLAMKKTYASEPQNEKTTHCSSSSSDFPAGLR